MSLHPATLGASPFWESLHIRIYLSFASLIWIIWEWLITFQEEFEYIWRPHRPYIKILYLFTRYFALIAQLINHFLTTKLLRAAPLSSASCRSWFIYQASVVQCLYTAVQSILMLRVYALYDCRLGIGIFLVVLLVTESTVMVVTGFQAVSKFDFGPTCLIHETPSGVVAMCITTIATQLIVWGMTFIKTCTPGSQRHPLMKLLIRDGGIVCAALTAFYSVTVPYSYKVGVLTHTMFSLMITLLSVLGCRVVLNMQDIKLPAETTSFWLTTLQCTDTFTEEWST